MAQLLGYKHPDHMFEDLTIEQLEGWLAWMRRFHPFPDRLDLPFAMLACTVANQWGSSTRPVDFMPWYDPLDEDISADELARRIGFP